MTIEPVRWGVLGPGSISHAFAEGVRFLGPATAILAAVGSRDAARAREFGDRWGIDHSACHGSYEALVADPAVDAVYIATPHPAHLENALLALAAGKPVLVEKPLTMNEAEGLRLADAARAAGLLAVEAMWTRFTPLMRTIRKWTASGELGDVRAVTADFGYRAPFDAASRLFDPALGGGGLLDVGCYPIAFVSMMLGEPVSVAGHAHLGVTGVDEMFQAVLGYPGGAGATVAGATRVQMSHEAWVFGTEKRLKISPPWWRSPSRMTLFETGDGGTAAGTPHDVECAGNGYHYQIDEFGRCLREGLTDTPVMPMEESLAILRTMDKLRAAWGLVYPGEHA